MTVSRRVSLPAALLLGLLASPLQAGSGLPEAVTSTRGLLLRDAQIQLQENGYAIAHASFVNKTQLWWHKKQQLCIRIAFGRGSGSPVRSVQQVEAEACTRGSRTGD